jgi:hypothetical protein
VSVLPRSSRATEPVPSRRGSLGSVRVTAHAAVRDILMPVTRDPNVPSLGRALLLALLLLVGAAIILGALGLILLTQLPENFF